MTRQARVGLLVGLGFIIMFGVLMSELTGGSAAPPIEEPASGGAVNEYAWAPVIEEIPAAKPEVMERLSATTQDEREQDEEPVAIVRVERSSGDGESQQARTDAARTVRRRGERKYTVKPSDMLIKIARKVYGPGHEDEYKRIYQANRNILSSESLVIAGQELVIPPLSDAREVRPQQRQAAQSPTHRRRASEGYRQMGLDELRRHFSAGRGDQAASGRVYVIRRGDNLTGIARRYLKDDSKEAVMKIYNANRDKLSSPDVLPVGVRIVIPSSSG